MSFGSAKEMPCESSIDDDIRILGKGALFVNAGKIPAVIT